MRVTANRDDDSVILCFEGDYFGLGFDTLGADKCEERGLQCGVAERIELSISPEAARDLLGELAELASLREVTS